MHWAESHDTSAPATLNSPSEKQFHTELQKRKCTCRKASLCDWRIPHRIAETEMHLSKSIIVEKHSLHLLPRLPLISCMCSLFCTTKISNHSFSSCAAPYYLTNQIISQLLIKLLTPQHSQNPVFRLELLGNLGNHTWCISVFFGPEKHTYTPCMVTRITKHFH